MTIEILIFFFVFKWSTTALLLWVTQLRQTFCSKIDGGTLHWQMQHEHQSHCFCLDFGEKNREYARLNTMKQWTSIASIDSNHFHKCLENNEKNRKLSEAMWTPFIVKPNGKIKFYFCWFYYGTAFNRGILKCGLICKQWPHTHTHQIQNWINNEFGWKKNNCITHAQRLMPPQYPTLMRNSCVYV